LGGLPKKAEQLKLLRGGAAAPSLTLDGGAVLFDGVRLPAARDAQARTTAEGIVKAYNLMGYDAAGVSRHDLAGGLSFLRELASRSDFAWLSANLVDSRRQPVFKSHLIKKVGELTVAIIGVTSEEGAVLAEAMVLPWQEVLPSLVANLQDAADFIILLADLPAGQIEAITASLPRINLVIQAEGNDGNQAPATGGTTLICRTASQGKYLGILDIDWRQGTDWGQNRQELLLDKRREFDQLSWQLRRQPTSTEMEIKRQMLADEIASLEKNGGNSSFKNRFQALPATLPDDPAVLAITENIRNEIYQTGKKAVQDKEKSANDLLEPAVLLPYVGWQACGECHPGQLRQWQQTRHAGAYRTLTARKQQFNVDCLSCHVTGLEKGASEILAPPADLQAVGCESCHGPGRQHASAPRQEPMPRKPSAEICLQCHTPERDDSFDYSRDLPKTFHRE
jgi:hypothetical protein